MMHEYVKQGAGIGGWCVVGHVSENGMLVGGALEGGVL